MAELETTSCCSTIEQVSCCEATDKAKCCGSDGGSCGCRSRQQVPSDVATKVAESDFPGFEEIEIQKTHRIHDHAGSGTIRAPREPGAGG